MSYFNDMKPWADQASAALGIPVSVILAQWSLETGYGGSVLARMHNNHGGIKFTGNPGSYNADGQHAGYNTMQAFVADYIRVLRLRYYDQVRQVAAAGGSTDQVIAALDASPYAEDPHYGEKLRRILKDGNLLTYDNVPAQTAPAPSPAPPASNPTRQVSILVPEGLGSLSDDQVKNIAATGLALATALAVVTIAAKR